jgi:hypothetical protein
VGIFLVYLLESHIFGPDCLIEGKSGVISEEKLKYSGLFHDPYS